MYCLNQTTKQNGQKLLYDKKPHNRKVYILCCVNWTCQCCAAHGSPGTAYKLDNTNYKCVV